MPSAKSQTDPMEPGSLKTASTGAASASGPKSKSTPTSAGVANGTGTTPGAAAGKEKDKEGKEPKKAKEKEEPTIDDLLLPRTLISRLARGSLPPNTSIQKDALLALTKSATVFISYLAHTANSLSSRKTMQADDVLMAIREMELDSVMQDRLEKEIRLFEDGLREKRKGYRDRIKAREFGVSQIDTDGDIDEQGTDHVSKKIKRNVIRDGDVEMDGGHLASRSTNPHNGGMQQAGGLRDRDRQNDGEDDDDEDDPSAQLLAEASRAADDGDVTGVDQNESENENGEDDEEDDDDEEEEEEEDENDDDDNEDDENENDAENGHEDIDVAERRKGTKYLAPDGRAEIDGSDEDSE